MTDAHSQGTARARRRHRPALSFERFLYLARSPGHRARVIALAKQGELAALLLLAEDFAWWLIACRPTFESMRHAALALPAPVIADLIALRAVYERRAHRRAPRPRTLERVALALGVALGDAP